MRRIEQFLTWYFVAPEPPIEKLPLGGKIPGLRTTFIDYGRLCYLEGSKDGFILGLVAALFLVLALGLLAYAVRSNTSFKGLLGAILAIL
jgi:hypothetical protein